VVAGALAKLFLKSKGIEIFAFVDQIGNIALSKEEISALKTNIEENNVRCPVEEKAILMEGLIKSVRKEGDTIGGSIYCKCIGLPSGLGEPVFEKLNAVIGQAMFSINAVKGVEVGIGFDSITKKGSEINDLFNSDFTTQTNNSGGVTTINQYAPLYNTSTGDNTGDALVSRLNAALKSQPVITGIPSISPYSNYTLLDLYNNRYI
jgi:chorismate synthase